MNRTIVDHVKTIAQGVMDSARLADVYTGIVTSVAPLEVTVDQRFTLPAVFLIVPESMTEYKVTIGDQEITIRRGLAVGDKLVLLRAHGGQQYVIMDRVV